MQFSGSTHFSYLAIFILFISPSSLRLSLVLTLQTNIMMYYNSAIEGLNALKSAHEKQGSWPHFINTASLVKRKMDFMTRCILNDKLECKTTGDISGKCLDRKYVN